MNVKVLVCVGAFVCFRVYCNFVGLGIEVNILLLVWCTDFVISSTEDLFVEFKDFSS